MTTTTYYGREHAVLCTGCFRRKTWRDDAICVGCHTRSAATLPGSDAGESMASASPASPSLSWLPAARDAQQCAAGDGPAPVAGNP